MQILTLWGVIAHEIKGGKSRTQVQSSRLKTQERIPYLANLAAEPPIYANYELTRAGARRQRKLTVFSPARALHTFHVYRRLAARQAKTDKKKQTSQTNRTLDFCFMISFVISVWQPIASIVTMQSSSSKARSNGGMVVISLLLSSTFTCPRDMPLADNNK